VPRVIYSSDSPDRFVPGTYTLTYSASDLSGNAATPVTRTVIVQPDVVPPVITLNGPALDNIGKGQPYYDPGATAQDQIDGPIQVIRIGSVDVHKTGRYEITYTATDESGNSSSKVRVVTVSSLEEDDVEEASACGVDVKISATSCQGDAILPAEAGACASTAPRLARGCGTDIWGCTDPIALNYNSRATRDDGSCVYLQPPSFGSSGGVTVYTGYSCEYLSIIFSNQGGPITSSSLSNQLSSGFKYYPSLLKIEGSECTPGEYLNTLTASNSAGSATVNFKIVILDKCLKPGARGCTDRRANNFNVNAECDDGSCAYTGCMLPGASNYDPRATTPGVCIFQGSCPPSLPSYSGGVILRGCRDPKASNYCATATEDNGSCRYCKEPMVTIQPISWVRTDPLEMLAITGTASNTDSVVVQVYGVTKTVPVTSLGNWAAIYSVAEILTFPYGSLTVNASSTFFCQGSPPAIASRKFVNKEPIIVLPYCPDRRVVIQVCNANAVTDDNFRVYLNDTYIGYLNLQAMARVGSVFIFDESANIEQADFTCPIRGMAVYRVDPSLLKASNTLRMQNAQMNFTGNYGTVQLRNYLLNRNGGLVSPCVIANLEYSGGDGESFSFSFNYESCCSGETPPVSSTVFGCTDPEALNYDPLATESNDSCVYRGCMLPAAANYDSRATIPGPCEFNECLPSLPAYESSIVVRACVDPTATNFCQSATRNDGSCTYVGCMLPEALNYDASATTPGLCIFAGCPPSIPPYEVGVLISGCTDPLSERFCPTATEDDGTCGESCLGIELDFLTIPEVNYENDLTVCGSSDQGDGEKVLVTIQGKFPKEVIVNGGSWCVTYSIAELVTLQAGSSNIALKANNICGESVASYPIEIPPCTEPTLSISPYSTPIQWAKGLTICGSCSLANGKIVTVSIQNKFPKEVEATENQWCATFSAEELLLLDAGSTNIRASVANNCGSSVSFLPISIPEVSYRLPVYIGVMASTGSRYSVQTITSFTVNGSPATIDPEFTSQSVVNLGAGSWRLTNLNEDQGGSIWAYYPLVSNNFSAAIAYNIEEEAPGRRADGICLVISKLPFLAGLGGGLGYNGGNPNSVAVEIDTYQNDFDADNHHIGILKNANVKNHLAVVPVENILNGTLEVEYLNGALKVKHNGSQILNYVIDIPGIIGTGAMTS
jgi:hypothetical protein